MRGDRRDESVRRLGDVLTGINIPPAPALSPASQTRVRCNEVSPAEKRSEPLIRSSQKLITSDCLATKMYI